MLSRLSEYLFATFVWPFLRLVFPSDDLLIFLSHTYRVLVWCFRLLPFQSCFLAFPFLLFWYMLGLLGEYNVRTHRELPSNSNHFNNILRLFDVLPNFLFTTSETMRDYYV